MSCATIAWIIGASLFAGAVTLVIGPAGIIFGAALGLAVGFWRGMVDPR